MQRRLFGYGSLVSPASAEQTLDRPVSPNKMVEALLPGYIRSWDVAIPVVVGVEKRLVHASFLNLREATDSSCNGIIIDLSSKEFQKMDLREKDYRRKVVQVEVAGESIEAETYIAIPNVGKPELVLQGYLDILDEALTSRPPAFAQRFWNSTEALPETTIMGNYRFTDKQQNEATGR